MGQIVDGELRKAVQMRMPMPIYAELRRIAKKNKRSVSAQALEYIEQALEQKTVSKV